MHHTYLMWFSVFYSYDWHEKLLEKTIKTELQMQEYLKAMEKAMEDIKGIFVLSGFPQVWKMNVPGTPGSKVRVY